LLSALEKKDGEEISLLRSTQETSLLKSIRELKQKSIDEAAASLDSLTKNKDSAESRQEYYSSRQRISSGEQSSLDSQDESRSFQSKSESAEATANELNMIPNTSVGMGISVSFGGSNLGAAAQSYASGLRASANAKSYESGRAATVAGYDRRQDDWDFQADQAKKEAEQLDKQILAAQIRQQISEADLENHDQQIAQAKEVEEFLKTKFTNQQLYSWMVSKLSSAYFQAYQMALQLGKQADQAFKHELGPEEAGLSPFVTSLYWDGLKKGLLAGEQLHQDLRRMEKAYLEANRRELEITKHVSLFQLDPTALLALRETGSCEIHIPEVLFDMDFPGHYFRRIKAVRLTIPCVVGPYTNVSATLTLTESWTRKNTNLADPDQPEQNTAVLPQTAIATSTANQDSGVFELSFSDPRYLPFEGAGAISSWRLELPSAIRPFDYDTLTDVILHLSYSARDGGATVQDDGVSTFKQAVSDKLVSSLNDLKKLLEQSEVPLSRLFSLRQDFSTEWNRLLYPGDGQGQTVTLNLTKLYFPRWLDYLWKDASAQPITLTIESATIYLNPALDHPVNAAEVTFTVNGASPADSDPPGLIQFDGMPGLSGNAISNPTGVAFALSISNGELRPEDWKDAYILVSYRMDVNK
jgi:Tc toxin complex TcA C-terminal TcB-binding domain